MAIFGEVHLQLGGRQKFSTNHYLAFDRLDLSKWITLLYELGVIAPYALCLLSDRTIRVHCI